jgi:hypothetical protein
LVSGQVEEVGRDVVMVDRGQSGHSGRG